MNSINFPTLFSFTRQEIRLLFKSATFRLSSIDNTLEIRSSPAMLPYARTLIVLPRRVGTAVQRNKLRRRLKALFYEEKLYSCGHDLIIFGRPGAAQLSFETLKHLLNKVCYDR